MCMMMMEGEVCRGLEWGVGWMNGWMDERIGGPPNGGWDEWMVEKDIDGVKCPSLCVRAYVCEGPGDQPSE